MDRSLVNNVGPNCSLKASYSNVSLSNSLLNFNSDNTNSKKIDNVTCTDQGPNYCQPSFASVDSQFGYVGMVPPLCLPPPVPPSFQMTPPPFQSAPPSIHSAPPSIQSAPPSIQSVPPSFQSVPSSFQSIPLSIQSVPPSILSVPPPFQSVPLSNQIVPPPISSVPPPIPNVPPVHGIPSFLPVFSVANDFSIPPPILSSGINDSVDTNPSKFMEQPDEEKQTQLLINKLNARLMSPSSKNKNTISILEYRKTLRELWLDINELERLYNRLSILHKSLTDEDWVLRLKEAESQKMKVLKGVESVKKISLQSVINLVKKRKSKRVRLKRKRIENQLKRKEEVAHCQAEHARVNMWLDQMNQETERIKREEDVKREADLVLSNVRQKKAEAKNMLSLLTTLGKLRNARIKNREARGEFVSKEAAVTFNEIIDKLKRMWLDQIKEYNIEEQGLKVMLNDGEVLNSNIKQSLNKQILQQWSQILFGESKDSKLYFPTDVDQLISVRMCWDSYSSKSEDATQIPHGWVVPSPPSSEEWKKYLIKKN